MKKGFTLIEMLAIIIVLALISLITYPIINGVINDSRNDLYNKQIDELERHTKSWISENVESLELVDGYSRNVTFEELYNSGFISDLNVKNPKTNELLKGCITISYNSSITGFDVNYNEECTPIKILYKDNSGANSPILYTNMIPIKYENNKWLVADLYSKWYDYNNKEWANAVVLNNGVTKNVGDEVEEEDISLWYVWIPRYKYTIFNGNNGSVSEQLIDVTFEKNTKTTGTVRCTDNLDGSETCTDNTNGKVINKVSTYTHPAFKFGNTELTGFWVGKFEVSGDINKITIKPNVVSLRQQTTLSNFFTAVKNIETIYGIDNADSHMIKNIEWGAVAYLKQSKYGLGITDIAINDNTSNYTGGGISNAYKTNVGGSTTGNIYGVYDMSGGAWEYTMGNMNDSDNAFYSSGAGFKTTIDSKYYDSYKYDTNQLSHIRGKLGDATKETMTNFGDLYGGWYNDYARFLYSEFSWFRRGGQFSDEKMSGIFYFNSSQGSGGNYSSTRAVLSAQ